MGIEAKSVRLDVLFEDDAAWYDIELQVQNTQCPAKRSRYYHAVKTVESFKKGEEYGALKPGYVIFICMFDFCGLNEPLYRYEMREEKNFLPLGDGQVTIFLNGKCSGDIPEDLKPFYLYLQSGEVGDEDGFVRRMDAAVQEAIQKEEVRFKVTLYDEAERLKMMLERRQAALDEKQVELDEAQVALDEKRVELEEAQVALDEKQAALDDARAEAERNAERADMERERADAAEKSSKLMTALVELGRFQDAVRVSKDEAFQKQLIEELGLSE